MTTINTPYNYKFDKKYFREYKDVTNIVFVGRLTYQKGFDIAIEICYKLIKCDICIIANDLYEFNKNMKENIVSYRI